MFIRPLFNVNLQGILIQRYSLPKPSLLSLSAYNECMTISNMDKEAPATQNLKIDFRDINYSIKWKIEQKEIIGFNLYNETISNLCIKLLRTKGTCQIFTKLRNFLSGRVGFRVIGDKLKKLDQVKITKNSEVYLVYEENEKKILKIIPKHQGYQELQILKLLFLNPHPNLLTHTSYYLEQQSYYIIMNYCQYGTLYSIYEKYNDRIIPKQIIQQIMQQILEGISHLHSLGIIHRDIKFDNILLYNNFQIVIIDYGYGIFENQKDYQQAGTPGYMAPEVIQNNSITNKIDIFSAGVVFHNLLSQKQLFTTYKQNQQGIVQIDHSITDQQELDLLKGMLNQDPKNRLSAQDCLSHPYFTDEYILDSGLNLFYQKEKRKNQLIEDKTKSITSMPPHKPRYSIQSNLTTQVNMLL